MSSCNLTSLKVICLLRLPLDPPSEPQCSPSPPSLLANPRFLCSSVAFDDLLLLSKLLRRITVCFTIWITCQIHWDLHLYLGEHRQQCFLSAASYDLQAFHLHCSGTPGRISMNITLYILSKATFIDVGNNDFQILICWLFHHFLIITATLFCSF